MQFSEAAKLWLEYHKSHSKENSIRAYKLVLSKFRVKGDVGSKTIYDL